MTETVAHYEVREQNPTGVPRHWMTFLQRMAGLKRGQAYQVVLIIPCDPDDEPHWSIMATGKVENQP